MAKTNRRRRNLLPDEYKRRGHVDIGMNELEAALFAPDKLKEIQAREPGYLLQDRSAVVEEIYIVTVHRLDGVWEYTIQHDGDKYRLPAKVVERMIDYRKSIITERRREQGRTRHRRIAERDQAEAEAEVRDSAAVTPR